MILRASVGVGSLLSFFIDLTARNRKEHVLIKPKHTKKGNPLLNPKITIDTSDNTAGIKTNRFSLTILFI